MQNAAFCDILHETKQSHKQTLESAQYRLEINFKGQTNQNNHDNYTQ